MKLIYQTDREFDDDKSAHAWCYFLAILWWLAIKFKPEIWDHDIIELWFRVFMQTPEDDLEEDGTVADPQAVIDKIIGKGKVAYIGKAGADYKPTPKDFLVGVYQRDFAPGEAVFSHKVAINNDKNIVLYDPWSKEGSRSVREGKLIAVRIFRVL